MQNWTKVILAELAKGPRTAKQISAVPHVAKMHKAHLAQRKARGAFITYPINTMVYDTLYRLRKQGWVSYDQGVYKLLDICHKCNSNFATHNDDGSCVKD